MKKKQVEEDIDFEVEPPLDKQAVKLIKEAEQFEKELEHFLSVKIEGLYKIVEATKVTKEIFPDGSETFLGEYDWSNVFRNSHNSFEGVFSDYANIPKSRFKLLPDGSLVATIIEDYLNFIVEKTDDKYKLWKQGKKKLWKSEYTIVVKLKPELGETNEENIRKFLKIYS
jgi:hypothetical protein